MKITRQVGVVMMITALAALTGCGERLARRDIEARYHSTILRQSVSSDVLSYIRNPETEHLSQSESVVASWGRANKARTHWFNMVAFDEEYLTAVRKYGFTMADYRAFNTRPRPHIQLDMEAVMDNQTLNAAYSSRDQMRIAVLKKLKTSFFDDSQTVSYESETLKNSVMVVTQTLNNLLTKLDRSPALAEDLSGLQGLEFDLMNIGRGYVRMLIKNDIVKLKIKAGYLWFLSGKKFEDYEDVKNM